MTFSSPGGMRDLTRMNFLESHGITEEDCSPHGEPASRDSRTWFEVVKEEVIATLSMTVALYACFVYNAIFVARILPAVGKGDYGPYLAAVFNTLWALVSWSWLQAHMEDAGTIPSRWREFVAEVGDLLHVARVRREWQPGLPTFCRRCNVLRPERTHHCRQCNACVLRMDHHCPFVKNCIGFNNQKFFLLLVTYGCILSIVGLATTLPETVLFVTKLMHWWDPGFVWDIDGVSPTDALLFISFSVLALLATLFLQVMMLFHIPLSAYNQTQLENGYDNMPNPYDLGSTVSNLSQIFGAPGLDWVLPIRPLRPLADGVAYQRGDMQVEDESTTTWLREGGSDGERTWRLRYHVPLAGFTRRSHDGRDGPKTVCSGCII